MTSLTDSNRMALVGFDISGSGFVTSEDFALALNLLVAPVSSDMLRDIPQVHT
jgi:hypothetical protein